MGKTAFPGMPYLNNYNYCRGNYYLDSKMKDCADKVISANDNSYTFYLRELKNEYRFAENYMYILEYVLNYINSIYRLTFFDYYNEPNSSSLNTLRSIQKRYNSVLEIYNEELNENNSDETLNKHNHKVTSIYSYKKAKKKRFGNFS